MVVGVFEGMQWLNDPPHWSLDGGLLHVVTAERTDFWRLTSCGECRDNGHFYYLALAGDFSVTLTVTARFEGLYDQAGLMVRADEEHWLKAGGEVFAGATQLSTVVTRGFSDWSVAPWDGGGNLKVRVARRGSALRVEHMSGAGHWALLRDAYLEMPARVDVGAMCCSPERAGFEATFRDFTVGPAAEAP